MILRTGRLEVELLGSRARFAGRIDDAVHLAEVGHLLPGGDVTLDLAGVAFVNSIGMRAWVRLIRSLRERGAVTLEAVSDVLIVAMNLVAEFRGAVRIASFHAGYACPGCGREATLLVDVAAHAGELAARRLPAQPCPECGGAMEPADFAERYTSIFAPPM